MTKPDALTLCMTIGNRPHLLDQTLTSLKVHHQFDAVVAVNDFGDDASNQVFLAHFPHGSLICTGQKRGHHAVVDDLYSRVNTEFILHIEDDWFFKNQIPFEKIFNVLSTHSSLTSVCLRELSDFSVERTGTPVEKFDGLELENLTQVHPEWYGYTFNPHIISRNRLEQISPFARFKKERHISRVFRQQGKHVGYLRGGGCTHIGENESVANRPEQAPLNIRIERFLKRVFLNR